ncbi:hypothetical protein [Hydrogenivirga sp.]
MNGDKFLEHGERISSLEAKVDALQRSVNEMKEQNQRIEDKLDKHLERMERELNKHIEHIAFLRAKATGIAVMVGTLVSGIVSGAVTFLFRKTGS